MAKVIGIDLGTTNSVVAVVEGGDPTVIANQEGSRLTPSVVAFTKEGETLVGQVAKRQSITNPENTIFSIKRFMGRRHDEVLQETKLVPYKVVKTQNGAVSIEARGKQYAPPEISALVLRKLKEAAEAYLGEKVTQAVITVPAYFNDSQRQATKDAGAIAGLEVLRIVNEPTAAALAYGLDKKKDETVAVYDLGGGTFDISILEIGEGVVEVKATNGDTHLGGDDFDQKVMDWIADEFKKEQGIDLRKDRMALQRLKEAAEKAKCELSTVVQTEINLPFITADASGPKHLVLTLTRAKLESLVADLIERSLGPCREAMRQAGVSARRSRRGHSRGRTDSHAQGAGGGQEALRQGAEQDRQSRRSRGGRRRGPGGRAHWGGQGPAAPRRDAALARHRDAGRRHDAGSSRPTRRSRRRRPRPSPQPRTASRRSRCTCSRASGPWRATTVPSGRFHLDGIPPAPRGVPQVEVTFDIDANGILNVSARDKATAKQQNITITASSGLTKDEIDRMKKEAEAHAAEDAKNREAIEAKNQCDSLVYSTERTLNEHGDKIPAEDKQTIEAAMTEAREALKGDDLERIKRAQEALTKASHKLAEVDVPRGAGLRLSRSGGQAGTGRCRERGASEGRCHRRRIQGSRRQEVDRGEGRRREAPPRASRP